jgi:hypothetical protein
MTDSPITAISPVPPGSTPLRQTALAVDQVLELPRAAIERQELDYLRCLRNRVRLVRQAMKDILADPGIETDSRDVMAILASLRQQAAALGDDHPSHQPGES